MKGRKILIILVLALGLTVWSAKVSEAAPVGTAFTYQGRLMDANSAADGLYDFEFKLFDDPCKGTQQGTIGVDDLDVIDGYFTVALDFGSVFDGNARWLEIAIRPGASIDGNDFDTLIPRQELTPTPYALYAQTAEDSNTIDGLDASQFAGSHHIHRGEDITLGTIHYDRYSAFIDLGIEGYLGNAPGDLARNNGILQPTLNADMLDGLHSNSFLTPTNDYGRSGVSVNLYEGATALVNKYLGRTAKAADSDKLDGLHASSFMTSGTDYGRNGVSLYLYEGATPLVSKYLGISATATNSDKVDGLHASSFAPSSHSHNTLYYTETESDSRFVNVTGDSMTGALNMTTTGTSIYVDANPTAGTIFGVRVDADQSAANNYSVYGLYSDTDSAASSANIYGTYSNAYGNGYSYGVYGYGSSATRSAYGLYGAGYIPSSATPNPYSSYGVYATGTTYGTGYAYGAYNTAYQNGPSGLAYGTYSYARGSDGGSAYGTYSTGYKQSTDTGGYAYGGYFTGDNDDTGNSYGIYTRAIGTGGGTNYGIYATASGGTTNYAGYFNGDVMLDNGSIGGGGVLKMKSDNGTETVQFLGGESTTSGGKLTLKEADGTTTFILDAESGTNNGSYIYMYNNTGGTTVYIDGDSTDAGLVGVYNTSGVRTITLDGDYSGDGRITTQELQITGGSDLSEQFDIDGPKDTVKPGMLVSIDPKRPGKLLISSNAYDKKVAGIISGAGGVKPGMIMGQEGSKADGDYPVALTGRVYCWVDASNGPVQPGDLLTTSSTPGHAMKVSNHNKALGAIIGKAMTSLEKGKGLVLVLVSLQ